MTPSQLDLAAALADHPEQDVKDLAHAFHSLLRRYIAVTEELRAAKKRIPRQEVP